MLGRLDAEQPHPLLLDLQHAIERVQILPGLDPGPSEPQEAGPIRGSPFRIVRYQQLSDIEALGDSEVIPRMPEPACQAGPIAPALSPTPCLEVTDME